MVRRKGRCHMFILVLFVVTGHYLYTFISGKFNISVIVWIKSLSRGAFGHVSTYDKNTNNKRRSFEGANHRADVMLFEYHRSETLFIGKMIGCRADTFYFDEPLWSISRLQYFTKTTQCELSRDNCRNYNSTAMNISNIIRSIYKCDTFTFKKLTSRVKPEQNCYRNRWAYVTRNITDLHNMCINSKLRVTRLLRISVDLTEDLIRMIPHLKIVYLYRDPRAIIVSRKKFEKGKIQRTMIKAVCYKMYTDSVGILRLAIKYPNNVVLVPAERLSEHPIKTSLELYKFLNITFLRNDRRQIEQWNRPQDVTSHHIKTYTHCPSMAWINVLSSAEKAAIDDICYPVYELLGYRKEIETCLNQILTL